jgi:hypothetical protein
MGWKAYDTIIVHPQKTRGPSAPQLPHRLGSVGVASPAAGPPNAGAGDAPRKATDWQWLGENQKVPTYHCGYPW